MPKVKISEYSATANSNTDVASINIDEGCAPSGINNAIRAVMGHLKDFQQGTNGDPFNGPVNGTLGATTASTANVTTLTTSSTVTHNGGTANGVAYLNGSKALTTGSALVFDGTNLGVGVTPSAWNTGGKAIEVKNGGNGLYSTGTNTLYQLSNAFLNSAGDFKYSATNFATQYTQYNGTHSWHYAPSGTAGNAITFTQAMTLSAAGSLYLGAISSALANENILTGGQGGGIQLIRNVSAAPTSGQSLGSYAWKGVDSANSNAAAEAMIEAVAAENFSGVTAGTNMLFYTKASGTGPGSSPTERARITSSGYFKASNTGTYNNASGDYHELRNNANANTVRITNTIASGYTDAIIQVSFTAYTPNTTTSWFLFCDDSTTNRVQLRSNGGIANYSANDVNLSDRREKTNFAPAGSYLDKICAIPVQTFNYIDQNLEEDGGLTLGVVAQDVQAIAPELVMESNWAKQGDEPKMRLSIYQTDLQYALMKCIQEQNQLITQLTARITALESA